MAYGAGGSTEASFAKQEDCRYQKTHGGHDGNSEEHEGVETVDVLERL